MFTLIFYECTVEAYKDYKLNVEIDWPHNRLNVEIDVWIHLSSIKKSLYQHYIDLQKNEKQCHSAH